ncbi:hypothetical protein HanOQP8_Chr15g0594601 [Helianthus annuus]|nr:hypothetical protein HanOQP8_Chr15g0594601 [Helianthus annuus]
MSCGATPAKLRPFFQRSHFGFFFPCMFRSGYEEPFCKFSRHFIFRQLGEFFRPIPTVSF